nr:MAG TPA: hypothetical protein [Caudoviricetes sp.]
MKTVRNSHCFFLYNFLKAIKEQNFLRQDRL